MECMKKVALSEPLVDIVEEQLVMSKLSKVLDIDLYTIKAEDLNFISKFELNITRDDTIYGLAVWFDIYFLKLNSQVKFTTGPYSRHTHWKQSVLYMKQPIRAKEGSVLSGTISVKKSSVDNRGCGIKVFFNYSDDETSIGYSQLYQMR